MEDIEQYFELVRQGYILKLGEWKRDENGGCYCTLADGNKIVAGWVKITDSLVYIEALDGSFARCVNVEKVFPSQK